MKRYTKKELERMMRNLGIDPEELEKEADKELEDELEYEEKVDLKIDIDSSELNIIIDGLKKLINEDPDIFKKTIDPDGDYTRFINKKYTSTIEPELNKYKIEPDKKKINVDLENILKKYYSEPGSDHEKIKNIIANYNNFSNYVKNSYKSLYKTEKKKKKKGNKEK